MSFSENGSEEQISTKYPPGHPLNQSDIPSVDTAQENFLIKEFERHMANDMSSF